MVTRPATGTIGIVREKIFGLPIDRKTLFSNHKQVYQKKIEKRQRALIIKLPFLRFFIKDNEKILLVTSGYSPTGSVERLIIGWLFVYLKRSLFVFTDKRFFHIPTTPNYKFRHCISEIPYSACKSIELRGSTLNVEYNKYGRKEKFFGIDRREKKKLKELLAAISAQSAKKEYAVRTSLCPRCTTPLDERKYVCSKCQLKFKTRLFAVISALLLPGGGYLYIRQYFLGFITAIVEAILYGYIGWSVVALSHGNQAGIFQLVICSCALVIVKCMTIVHTSDFISEFIPTKRLKALQPAAANASSRSNPEA